MVVVVGTHEDEDGIEVVAVLFLQLVCLARDVVPFSSAHTIDVWSDAEHIFQESPVFLFRTIVAWVGDGVAEVSHSLSFPRMLESLEDLFFLCDFFLCHRLLGEGRHRQGKAEYHEDKCLFLHLYCLFYVLKLLFCLFHLQKYTLFLR